MAVAICAFEIDDVGLGLLQREAVAGAGGHQFTVLPDAQPGEVESGLQHSDLRAGGLQLLLQFPRPGRGIDQARAGLRELRLVGSELRLRDVEIVLVRGRIDAEQQLALLDQPVGLDRHLDHPSPHLRE